MVSSPQKEQFHLSCWVDYYNLLLSGLAVSCGLNFKTRHETTFPFTVISCSAASLEIDDRLTGFPFVLVQSSSENEKFAWSLSMDVILVAFVMVRSSLLSPAVLNLFNLTGLFVAATAWNSPFYSGE